MRTRARHLVLLTALSSVAGALLGPASPAAAAPVISVTTAITWNYPKQVPPASSGLTTRITVTVSSSEPVAGATATATGFGLVVTNPAQSLGTLAQPVTVSFDVAGSEPGLHQLFVSVTVPGGGSFGTTVPYVWTSGSPLPPGTNKLYKRSFGWQGTEHVAGLDSSTRAVRMLSIVGPTQAFVGLPAFGVPTCQEAVEGCLPYTYDFPTNLLQVGTGIIAAPHVPGMYTDGLIPAAEQDGEVYGRYDFRGQLDTVSPRTRLHGTYRYSSRDYPTGLTYEKVTFATGGTYALTYAVDGGRKKHLSGRYRVGKRGAVTFYTSLGTVAQRGTILSVVRTPPRLGPFQPGIWLILSGKKGKHPDGNLLRLVDRRK